MRYNVYFNKSNGMLFILMVDNIKIAQLYNENGEWVFKYIEEFKQHLDEYNMIFGFPDIDKEYRSNTLWPFFRIRIPGLKQPKVREILEKEQIDKRDEAALLRRFGHRVITNPYELVPQ